MNAFKHLTKKLFSKPSRRREKSGLSASLEELIETRRYVRYLQGLRQNRTFTNRAGEVKSAFKGRGMELEEIRAYSFGDDVRDIDWRVTARKEVPYTKLFAEERDHEIYIWLDLSAPMLFGTRKELKSVAAAKLAALLGWMSLENKDRFGGVIFDGSNSWVFKPQNSRAQLMAMLKKISELSKLVLKGVPQDENGAAKSLRLLQQTAKNQATVFILSDFNHLSESFRRQLPQLSRKTRLYLVNIFDVLEEFAPQNGEYMAEYGGRRLIFDSNSQVYREDYEKYFAEKRQKVKDFCMKFGCRLLEFRSGGDFVNNLKFF